MTWIINLGLPNSGTALLATALRSAGLTVVDQKLRRGVTSDPVLAGSFVGRQIYEGYFETGDPLARLTAFDALSEISVLNDTACLWPQCDPAIIRAMRRHHPEGIFLATWRPAEVIAQSMGRQKNQAMNRLATGAVPGLPKGFGTTQAQRLRWIEAHYAFLGDLFSGDPRFLLLDITSDDAQRRLSAQISRPVPWWEPADESDTRPTAEIDA